MANINHDAWEKIFQVLNLDVSKEKHFISAARIKEITGREARLMAKMDSTKDVPPVMVRHGYFLLPVSRSGYVILKGNGFHELESAQEIAQEFQSKISFHLATNHRNTSEMQYLDYCSNAGLIEHVANDGRLYPMIRGREGGGVYSFRVGDVGVSVTNPQIEVDLGLESQNSIILLEAKAKTPRDFIIRQLYYPYRKFESLESSKKVIPIFFTYDDKDARYNFWQYAFEDMSDYNSIKIIDKQSFTIIQENTVSLAEVTKPVVQVVQKQLIPQANDLDRIIKLVQIVSQGVRNANAVAEYFAFDSRQSSYYREAAEALGFVAFHNSAYELTEAGQHLLTLQTEDRNIFFSQVVNNFSLFRVCMEILQLKGTLTLSDIESVIAKQSNLSGSTIPRRAQSMKAWLKWMAEKTGTFEMSGSTFRIA